MAEKKEKVETTVKNIRRKTGESIQQKRKQNLQSVGV